MCLYYEEYQALTYVAIVPQDYRKSKWSPPLSYSGPKRHQRKRWTPQQSPGRTTQYRNLIRRLILILLLRVLRDHDDERREEKQPWEVSPRQPRGPLRGPRWRRHRRSRRPKKWTKSKKLRRVSNRRRKSKKKHRHSRIDKHVCTCIHTHSIVGFTVYIVNQACNMGSSITVNGPLGLQNGEVQFQPQFDMALTSSQSRVQHEYTRCCMSILMFPFPFSHAEQSTVVCSRNHPYNLSSWKYCDMSTAAIAIPRLRPTNAPLSNDS